VLKDNLKVQIVNNKASNKPKGRNNFQANNHNHTRSNRNHPKEKRTQNNTATNATNAVRDNNGNDAVHIIQEFVGVLKDIKEAIPSLKQQQQQLQQSQQYQVQSPQLRRQPVKRQRTVEFVSDEQEENKFDAATGNTGQKNTLNAIFAAVSKGDSLSYGYH